MTPKSLSTQAHYTYDDNSNPILQLFMYRRYLFSYFSILYVGEYKSLKVFLESFSFTRDKYVYMASTFEKAQIYNVQVRIKEPKYIFDGSYCTESKTIGVFFA